MMWMEIIISVLATVGYALYSAKQAPPTPKENQEDASPAATTPAPRSTSTYIKACSLVLCVIAAVVLGTIASSQSSRNQPPFPTPPKVAGPTAQEGDAIAILQR